MDNAGRITTRNWDLYDTRHVVYRTAKLSPEALKNGYDWAYRSFYSWSNILAASNVHPSLKHKLKHLTYAGGWKKFEPLWNFLIKTGNLNNMLPLLEAILAKVSPSLTDKASRRPGRNTQPRRTCEAAQRPADGVSRRGGAIG